MSKRLDKIIADQDAVAVEKAWADEKTHHSPSTGGILNKLFGDLSDRQAEAGRTKPMLRSRRRPSILRRKGQ